VRVLCLRVEIARAAIIMHACPLLLCTHTHDGDPCCLVIRHQLCNLCRCRERWPVGAGGRAAAPPQPTQHGTCAMLL
jgi:hypothetical protein